MIGSTLEPLAASIRQMLDDAAAQSRFGKTPLYVRTAPSICQELPYNNGASSQAGWIGKHSNSEFSERHYSALNPFPKMYIQLTILDIDSGQGPSLLGIVHDWIKASPGREAYFFRSKHHRLYDLSTLNQSEFHELIWPSSMERHDGHIGLLSIKYRRFYRLCRAREKLLVARCLFGAETLTLLQSLILSTGGGAWPSEYPEDEAFHRPKSAEVFAFLLIMTLTVIVGAVVSSKLLLGRFVSAVSLAEGLGAIAFAFFVLAVSLYLQYRLLKAAFSDEPRNLGLHDTKIGTWSVGLISTFGLFFVANIGHLLGFWEAFISLGQLVGLLVTLVFSPLILGSSVIYAFTSPPAEILQMSCGAIHSAVGVTGLSGWDLFTSSLKAIAFILTSPISEREAWLTLTGLAQPSSMFEVSWNGITTWAVGTTFLVLFLKCFFVG